MTNEYIIYCDESDIRGKYYSNFYGGVIVNTKDLLFINRSLEEKKQTLNLHGEVKWSKVTSNYCEKYIELINAFFDFIAADKIKARIMFTQNVYTANNLTAYHRDHEYFLLYYQFIKHGFGLPYTQFSARPTKIRIYLDKLPQDTKEKVEQFKSYLHSISLSPLFHKASILIPKDQIAEIDSHQHILLQCIDIVLGAIQFRLNDKHKEIMEGGKSRGKRTIAKEKLYKHIYFRIKQIYPGFNIGCTTGQEGDPSNLWRHRYRHWLFIPKDKNVDLTKAKPKRKNPASAKSMEKPPISPT